MTTTKQSTFSQLPIWAKGTIYVVSAGIIIYLGFRFGNKIRDYFKEQKESKGRKEVKWETQKNKEKNIQNLCIHGRKQE